MPSRRDRGRRPLRGHHRWHAVALVAASLGTLVACSDDDGSGDRTVVEVFGNLTGEPGRQLGEALRTASRDSGVELRYIGVTSFSEQLDNRLDQGDRPAIALLPQPGRLADLSRRGLLEPLGADLAALVQEHTPAPLVELVTIDGRPAAAWLAVDVKGLVWYRPAVFVAGELTVPRTLDEFAALAADERADDDGVASFCGAMEAGGSTGWVGTDWVESFVLRRLGADVYDDWTAGRITFDSPEIEGVFTELDGLLRSSNSMADGAVGALSTPWEMASDQLLADAPRCAMVHQADFLRREFPAGTSIGPDGAVDFFVLPAVAESEQAPLLIGGLLAAPLDDEPGVDEAMKVLAGAEFAQLLADTGLFLSPHDLVEWGAGDPTSARLAELVRTTDTVRFDGSDLMVPEIGTGSFWTGMRAFIGGEAITTVLATIEAGRPSSVAETTG